MKKLRPDVELIHSDNQEAAMFDKMATLVAQKMTQARVNPAEMTTQELTDEVLLQPWALPREIATAVLRLLPVTHQNKFRCYEDHGCFRCGPTNKPHQSLGLCASCHARMHSRIKSSITKRVRPDHLTTVKLKVGLLTGSTTNAKRVLQEVARNYPALSENSTANL
jgi:hypothetical protein